MKKNIRSAMGAAFGLALALSVISCASFTEQSGFLDGYYKNLQPGQVGGAKEFWVKPGVDLSHYDKVMLDRVVFYFAHDSDDKGIEPIAMKELADDFNQKLTDALKDRYPIVAEPGPGVVRIKIALTGIKQSRPVLSGISSIMPGEIVISAVEKETTGAWMGSGVTRAELMAIDPINNEVISVAVDEQSAGYTQRFSAYGSAKEAFTFWAGRIREFMDRAHGVQEKQ